LIVRPIVATLLVVAAIAIAPSEAADKTSNCQDRARKAYDRDHWQAKPRTDLLAGCPSGAYIRKAKERFYRWVTYRKLTPYRGCSGGGVWLRFTAIPGDVVYRESSCSWTARNPSGACGAYQFIGWTSCDASSWSDKMRHHATARYVLRVQGPGAWEAW
jgi:hypothetical protein